MVELAVLLPQLLAECLSAQVLLTHLLLLALLVKS
jgi:hypothetical protein